MWEWLAEVGVLVFGVVGAGRAENDICNHGVFESFSVL